MSLRYGYFDSEINGYDEEGMPIFDRAESSDFLAMFISKIISDGVLADPADCFQVVAGDGMNLIVRPGFTSYKRIDRVVLRANYLLRLCEIIVKEGTPDANPVPPELLQPASGDYYELCLATVLINSNQTVITQANITDTRYDSSVCGVVTQVIDHLDTSVFFKQLYRFYDEFVDRSNTSYEEFVKQMEAYLAKLETSGNNQLQDIVNQITAFEKSSEEQFREWFDNVKNQLSEDVAGHLQLQLDNHEERIQRLEQIVESGEMETALATAGGEELATDAGEVIAAFWRYQII